MSEFVHKEGFGSMKKVDQKGNPNAPAMRGELMFEGRLLDLAGWSKVDKNGNKYMSLSGKLKVPYVKPAPKPAEVDPFDQEIPF